MQVQVVRLVQNLATNIKVHEKKPIERTEQENKASLLIAAHMRSSNSVGSPYPKLEEKEFQEAIQFALQGNSKKYLLFAGKLSQQQFNQIMLIAGFKKHYEFIDKFLEKNIF